MPEHRSKFSGWLSFSGVRKVEIYGRMEGILFKYHGGKSNQYFGNIEARPVQAQRFEWDERIVNLAIESSVPDQDVFPETRSITSASSVDRPSFLPKLMVRSLSGLLQAHTKDNAVSIK